MKYSLEVYWPRSEVLTSGGVVFIGILVSDYNPLASLLPFNSFVSLLASPLLPIVRSQWSESQRQGITSFNKNE